jgi:hypothetical protein
MTTKTNTVTKRRTKANTKEEVKAEIIISQPPAELPSLIDSSLDPSAARALQIFASGKIPKEAIKTHIGKGGKTFSYVSHAWVTRQLQDLPLPIVWSWNVLDYQILKDGSPIARAELIVDTTLPDGRIISKKITEVGTAAGDMTSMNDANKILSSASRALCRCVMRMFGVGLEFYANEDTMTAEAAKDTIFGAVDKNITNVEGRKKVKENIVAAFHEVGISMENVLDKFEQAWQITYDQIQEYKKAI